MANTLGPLRVDLVEGKRDAAASPAIVKSANVTLSGAALNLLKALQLKPAGTTAAAAVPPLPEGVRVVALDEYKRAAACLAEAFAVDEVVRYPIDTPDRAHWTAQQKWELHVEILEYVVYAHIMKGLVTTVGDFEAVALWMPPNATTDDPLTQLRSGMWRLSYRLSPEGRHRFFTEFLPLLHDTKVAILGPRDPSSWYLVYIGTTQRGRGKGHASKLIRHVTAQADKEGVPVYLESSNEKNPPIYRRFGFETVRTVWLQRGLEGNVGMDIMVREAGRGEKGGK